MQPRDGRATIFAPLNPATIEPHEHDEPRDEDPFGFLGARVLDRYDVEAMTGDDPVAAHYRARGTDGDRWAIDALKIPSLPDSARERLEEELRDEVRRSRRIAREAPAALPFKEASLVRAHDGTYTPCIVRPFSDGDDLVARGPRSALEAVALLSPIARALEVAKNEGLAHLGLLPAAIRVDKTHGAELLGLGNGAILERAAGLRAVSRGSARPPHVASPKHAAPEQIDPALGAPGFSTDVYSFALLFMELIAGRPVFGRIAPMDLYPRIVDRARRPSLRDLDVPVSRPLDRALVRALSVDPRHRHPSVASLFAELKDAALVAPSTQLAVARDLPRVSTPVPRRSGGKRFFEGKRFAAAIGLGLSVFFVEETVRYAIAWRREEKAKAAAAASASASAKSSASNASLLATNASASSSVASASSSKAAKRPLEPMVPIEGASPPKLVDRTEVTVAAYAMCVSAGQCTTTRKRGLGFDENDSLRKSFVCNLHERDRASFPVNCVSYKQAQAYCSWAGKRLPTGAEWELAAHGKRGTRYPWGDEFPRCDRAVFARYGEDRGGCHKQPAGSSPVEAHPDAAGPTGALDMAGNLWEWTTERNGAIAIMRGGAWDSSAVALTVSSRLEQHVDNGEVNMGFRCVKDAPPEP